MRLVIRTDGYVIRGFSRACRTRPLTTGLWSSGDAVSGIRPSEPDVALNLQPRYRRRRRDIVAAQRRKKAAA
jgi:hypothetical protein